MRDLCDSKSVCFDLAGAKTSGRSVDASYLNDNADLVPTKPVPSAQVGAKMSVTPIEIKRDTPQKP